MSSSPRPIKVLANAREVIDAIARQGAMTPSELAEEVGMPRPSAYRLVLAMVEVDLLETDASGAYQLSRRWLHLADAALDGMAEWRGADRMLEKLVDGTGLTAFLSVPRGDEAVCIRWAPGRGIGVLALRPGRALPLHAGGAGRVLLAARDDDAVDDYLSRSPFDHITPKTLVEGDELRADVELTRRLGYCVSDEDVTLGIGAVGVVIRGHGGEALGAVSLGGLAQDVVGPADRLAELLISAAREFSTLGEVLTG